MTPFHSNQANALYTSQNALSTRSFGYSYPDVVDWDKTPAQLSANVKTTVNNLYGPNAPRRRRRRALDTNTHYQYFVNIKYDSTPLSEPLQIHFFVGAVPANPSSWATAATLAGTFPAGSHTDNTQVGQVALTDALDGVPQLHNLSPRQVVPYLKANLNYRVQKPDDSVLDNKDVPGLRIAIVGQLVKQPASAAQFPKYGPFEEFPDATPNIVGGLKPGQTL